MDKMQLKIKVDEGKRDGEGSLIESAAVQQEREQQAFLDAASVEQAYQEVLASYVLEKQEQVILLEDRLESIVDRQRAILQRIQGKSPGRLALPNTKRAWAEQEQQSAQRLQQLSARLEHVREIRDGMGLHAPKIDELATRKLRIKNPELAESWGSMREALRVSKIAERAKRTKTAKNRAGVVHKMTFA